MSSVEFSDFNAGYGHAFHEKLMQLFDDPGFLIRVYVGWTKLSRVNFLQTSPEKVVPKSYWECKCRAQKFNVSIILMECNSFGNHKFQVTPGNMFCVSCSCQEYQLEYPSS